MWKLLRSLSGLGMFSTGYFSLCLDFVPLAEGCPSLGRLLWDLKDQTFHRLAHSWAFLTQNNPNTCPKEAQRWLPLPEHSTHQPSLANIDLIWFSPHFPCASLNGSVDLCSGPQLCHGPRQEPFPPSPL